MNTVLKEWAKIPSDTLQNLVENFPQRAETVIAPKGGRALYEYPWIYVFTGFH